MSALLREVADALEVDAAEVPDAVKRERVLALVEASGRVDAALAREVGVFAANAVWAGDGARSAGGWLMARTELSKGRAAAVVATARDLRSCPHVAAAWASGAIGTAKVRTLLSARAIHPERFCADEADLVAEVAPLTVARASIRVARWAQVAEASRDAERADEAGEDPDGVPGPDPLEQNSMHLSQSLDGRWFGDTNLDPVTGAERWNAIAALIDAKFAAGVYRADDGMTAAQRRAACEHELVMRGANPTQTKHGDLRPTVSVEIDARTLAGVPVRDAADAASRRCGLDDGTPVARSTIERLLCTCRLTALATRLAANGTIEVVGVTDVLRDATAKQRKALKQRDGGCAFPGCAAPFDWCEAHHLWQHETGGPTLLHNLVLLCKHHHHLVHEGGWHLWRDQPSGQLHLRKPDGTPVPVVAHGAKVPSGPPPPQPPPPPRRNGPPRYLTRRELAELEHRRRQRRRRPPRPD